MNTEFYLLQAAWNTQIEPQKQIIGWNFFFPFKRKLDMSEGYINILGTALFSKYMNILK